MSTMAFLGDRVSVDGFKMIGFDTVSVTSDDPDLSDKVLALIQQGISIIFVTEEVADGIQEKLEDFMDRYSVTIVRLPSKKGSTGTGLQRIKELCIKALGTDLLFQEEE